MGAKIRAFDIFQTPFSSHYRLPLKSHAVLRIHDIFLRIRIRGSMPLKNGSGSCWFFFIIDLQDANKKLMFFKKFFYLLLFEGTVHLHHFSKIKSQKEFTKR